MTMIALKTLKQNKAIITSRMYNGLGIEQILMVSITEEQEKCLDAKKKIKVENYEISPKDIICYGDINLNTNSKDYRLLETLQLPNYYIERGQKIPNNYDYKEHCCYTNKKLKPSYLNSPELQIDGIDWIKTKNIAKVIQYNHGMLGKPKKICIFNNFVYNK